MKRCIVSILLVVGVMGTTIALSLPAQEPAQPGKLYIYSGTLRSIDRTARTITVGDGATVAQRFVVPTDAEIIVKDKAKGTLSDLMVGDGIQIKYTDDDGAHVAHQISPLEPKSP